MKATITELKKALSTNGQPITIEHLTNAKDIYKEIAQQGYKSKEWTTTNIAQALMVKAFKNFVENNDLKDYRKSIFMQDNGYNVVLALKTTDGYDNLLTIKVKSEDFIIDLIDNHEFYIVG